MKPRGAAIVLFLCGVAAGAPGLVRAADETVVSAFLAKARAAHARGNRRVVERLVASDRWVAFDAFYESLKEDDLASGTVAESLASAYSGAFQDRALLRALDVARAWTPAQRARRRQSFDLRKAARQAMRDGRLDEAAGTFARALEVYRNLGDIREEAWSHSNLGAVAALRGQGRQSLAHLERAREAARRAGDLGLLGVVALNRAYVLDDLGETEAALAAYDEALTTSRTASDPEAEGRILASRGTLVMKTGRLEEASANFREAAAVSERSADFEVQAAALLNLAAISKRRGDTEDQIRLLRRSAEAGRRGGLPIARVDASLILAREARQRGAFDEARRRLDFCRRTLLTADDVQRLFELDLEEASLRIDAGRYEEALQHLATAEKRIEGLDLGGRPAALFLTRAVALYDLGDFDGAVGQLRASLAEARSKDSPEREESAHAQLGYVLFTLGDAAGGLAEIREAVRIAARIGNRADRGSHLDAIGFIRYRAGDLDGAKTALEAALADLSDDHGVDRAEAIKDLGLVFVAMGGERRGRGLDLLRQAREIFTRLHDTLGVFQTSLFEADAALSDRNAALARAALARAGDVPAGRYARQDAWLEQHLLGRLAELEGNVPEALRRHQRAVDEVESLRREVRPAPWRAALLEDRIAPYRSLVRLLRDQGDVESAWRIARTAKARTFVESLAVPGLEGLDPQAGSRRPRPDRPPVVREEGDVVPAGLRLPLAAGPVGAGRLRSLLRRDERLIDFFVDGREVTAFILGIEGLSSRTLRRGDLDGALASRWPGRPGTGDAAVTSAFWRAMSSIGENLFEPLADDLAGATRLLIVPGGALQGVPFAAVGFLGGRLVDRFDLSILPAAEALLSRERPAAGAGALIMGDPASAGSRLPAAAREARAIGALASGASVLTGGAATESAFRALAPGADWIHVAAHGRIDRIAPSRTHLALAGGGNEDGRLEAGEVAAMDLAASLVVLSGCGTGIDGPLARGDAPADERAGLPRAFLQAGAGTVVADLWEVDDSAAAAIMPRLYAAPGARDPAAAVAALQRDLAAGRIRGEDGARLDHPYYWAGLLAWGGGFARPPVRTAP